jgi:hypothetical protein
MKRHERKELYNGMAKWCRRKRMRRGGISVEAFNTKDV